MSKIMRTCFEQIQENWYSFVDMVDEYQPQSQCVTNNR